MKAIFLLFMMLTISLVRLSAQLCTGKLGNPSASITFGNPAQPVSLAGNTGYSYNSSGCPAIGEYSLSYLSFDCSAGTWHTIVADHSSGDVNGYFMLVSAASSPSPLYVDTVSGLCNGTNYEFSFWVLNMVKPGTLDHFRIFFDHLDTRIDFLNCYLNCNPDDDVLPGQMLLLTDREKK